MHGTVFFTLFISEFAQHSVKLSTSPTRSNLQMPIPLLSTQLIAKFKIISLPLPINRHPIQPSPSETLAAKREYNIAKMWVYENPSVLMSPSSSKLTFFPNNDSSGIMNTMINR
jgi:hypothetical protein